LQFRNAGAAAAQKHAGPQIIHRSGLVEVLADELENFLEPQRHDAAQMFEVMVLMGKPSSLASAMVWPLMVSSAKAAPCSI